MNKSREQFERWFNGEYETTMKNYDEPLIEFVMKQLFTVWQASRESLEVELPHGHEEDDEYDYFAMGYNSAIDKCKQILISNGVKVK